MKWQKLWCRPFQSWGTSKWKISPCNSIVWPLHQISFAVWHFSSRLNLLRASALLKNCQSSLEARWKIQQLTKLLQHKETQKETARGQGVQPEYERRLRVKVPLPASTGRTASIEIVSSWCHSDNFKGLIFLWLFQNYYLAMANDVVRHDGCGSTLGGSSAVI